jgi:putative transposase
VHKITTDLIRDSQTETFVIEDLHIAGMIKNERLSRTIADASFSEFFRQMKYKCEWYGKNLVIIDRFAPSSKRCSKCGEINDELTLSDREWTCKCGVCHDRDLNAAKNIKWFGLNNSPVGSRGGPVESGRLRRTKKQETYSV